VVQVLPLEIDLSAANLFREVAAVIDRRRTTDKFFAKTDEISVELGIFLDFQVLFAHLLHDGFEGWREEGASVLFVFAEEAIGMGERRRKGTRVVEVSGGRGRVRRHDDASGSFLKKELLWLCERMKIVKIEVSKIAKALSITEELLTINHL
jgi:hypothetical protein